MYDIEIAFPVVQDFKNDSWNKLKIGESSFTDDIWDISSFRLNKTAGVHSANFLKFKPLLPYPKILELVKRYCYIRFSQVKPVTVVQEYNSFIGKFVQFIEMKKIDTLELFTKDLFLEFNLWLKQLQEQNNYQATYMSKIAHFLYSTISTAQSFEFDYAPKSSIELGVSLFDWWNVNKLNKNIRQNGPKHRNIPIEIWQTIIARAWKEDDIKKEIKSGVSKGLFRVNNAKFGILIQAHTGLRISEVLYLKTGCVEKDKHDKYWLTTQIEKTESEPVDHKILIPKSIYELILKLELLTKPLRDELEDSNYLFYILQKQNRNTDGIARRFKPVTLESGKWNYYNLTPFLERNEISKTFVNDQREEIKISSHCFRHTYAKIAVTQSNVNPVVLQTHFKHLSIEMTMHYLSSTKEELRNSYIEGMFKSDSIFTQGSTGEEFKKKITQFKAVQSFEEITDSLSKLYGLNPLPFGLCLYDFKRGHCPHIGVKSCYSINCKDFVSNETFLDNFVNESEVLKQHIEKCSSNGQIIEVKKAKFELSKVNEVISEINKGKHE